MASIHTRNNSTVLQGSFTANGERLTTTLHTKDRQVAAKRAGSVQALIDALDPRVQSRQAKLLGLVEEVFDAFDLPVPWEDKKVSCISLSSHIEAFLARRKAKVAPATAKAIQTAMDGFLVALGDVQLSSITGADVQRWYDQQVGAVSVNTANGRFVYVNALLENALAMGYIQKNPAEGVEMGDGQESSKEAMSHEDLGKVVEYLTGTGEFDWRLLCWISRYTGLRLMDAVRLTWGNIHVDHISCVTAKTGAEVVIPILPQLASFVKNDIGHQDSDFLFPELAGLSAQTLSADFVDILTDAGVDMKERVLPNGRLQRAITFHSLRAAFCSDLAKRGVPEDLRMLLAGHTKASTHRGYVKQSPEDIRKRLEPFIL